MKLPILMCLVLALALLALPKPQLRPAQQQEQCPGQMAANLTRGKLNGHWWIQANSCDHMVYLWAFADGGGAPPTEGAVDRYFKSGHLDVSLPEAFYTLFGNANATSR